MGPILPYLERFTVDGFVGLVSRTDPLESIDPKLTNGPKMTLMLFYDPSHVDLNGLMDLVLWDDSLNSIDPKMKNGLVFQNDINIFCDPSHKSIGYS